MSLGNTYSNNQNGSKFPEISIYSNYRMNNADSKIDATCLTFRYWKTNLCVSIYPKKETGNDEISFDTDNGITIYLSHTKARILKNELEKFLQDPITYNAVGVPAGQAAITISNGAEYGKDTPVLTIRKVSETGEVVSSFAYEFKRNYHFGIRNYDGKTYDENYEDYQNIEIEQFITLLDEYTKAVTNAVAFTVMEQRKYSAAKTDSKIEAIANSLGVEMPKSSSSNKGYNSNTYFNNNRSSSSNSNVSYGTATLDDLE